MILPPGDCKQGPRLHVWAPIQPSSISPTIFLSLHSLINVLCALWCRIIDQTKWPGSVNRQPPRLPSLPLTFTCCYQERMNIFHLLSVGNILWQSNNLFHIPFECLTMCLLKGNDKGVRATGVASWLFWSGRSPLTSALQWKQQVVLSTVAALYQVMRGFFSCPHQTQTAYYHSVAALEWLCECEGIHVEVSCATCMLSCRWRIKEMLKLEASQYILVYQ